MADAPVSSSRVVSVDIHGQRYALRSDIDPQLLGELAGYLDAKMRLAARELASADPVRIAIVAALNICEELHRARTQADGVEERVKARAADIERLIDGALAEVKIKVVNA
jgi:cell division protein ZapA